MKLTLEYKKNNEWITHSELKYDWDELISNYRGLIKLYGTENVRLRYE